MCGIAGIFSSKKEDRKLAAGMVERIIHRGPDHQAVRGFLNDRIWLGHARLSIIDLSDLGFQPMSCKDGKYWIVYNGEIYNYLELNGQDFAIWRMINFGYWYDMYIKGNHEKLKGVV